MHTALRLRQRPAKRGVKPEAEGHRTSAAVRDLCADMQGSPVQPVGHFKRKGTGMDRSAVGAVAQYMAAHPVRMLQ
jgi:hypothetical protein